ncbi:MAG: OmpP1/FadL family transporter [Sphingomonadales bacterium]
MKKHHLGVFVGLAAIGLATGAAQAGPMGSELDLGMTPASGGMEGVGIARPQDNTSMLFGNPATLTQLKGATSFTFGGSYVSPELKANGTVAVPNPANPLGPPALLPFQGDSRLEDLAMPNAAVVQRLSDNLVVGMGFTGLSGLGSDWRSVLPPSFSLVADLKLFGGGMSVGYKLNDQISFGGTFLLGIGSLQVGTVPSTASVNDFGVGGIVGVTYDNGAFTFSTSYKSEVQITYDRVLTVRNILDPTVTPDDAFAGFTLTQPREIMIGLATEQMIPDTLLEVDFRWKNYSDAEGYSSFWRNQWKIAFGVQHHLNPKMIMRAGYSYSRAIAKPADQLGFTFGNVGQLFAPGFPGQLFGLEENVAPVTPGLIQLVQATIADGHWQQGVSVGMGYMLMPNLRADVNFSFSYDGNITLNDPLGSGQSIDVNGKLLAAGMGLTWTFN